MLAVTENNAVKNLHNLIKEVNNFSDPIIIATDDGLNAVLVSEDDWKDILETMRIYSVRGLKEKIIEASKEPISECKVYDPNEAW